MKYSSILLFLLLWSILGYPFLALLSDILNLPSSQLSILMRSLAVALAFILVMNPKSKQPKLFLLLFLTFWMIYFYRLSLATILDFENLGRPDQTYWIWGFGVCFLPALAALTNTKDQVFNQLYFWTSAIAVVAMSLALISGNTFETNELGQYYDTNRLRVSALNPISMGHLGASAILMSVCALTSRDSKSRFWWVTLIVIALGGATLILANSRGPQVAAMGSIALLFLAGAHQRRTFVIGLAILFIIISAVIFQYEALFSSSGIFGRLVALFGDGDISSNLRLVMYNGAWDQFMVSPLWGNGIEENTSQFYPHNLILEALMATGLLGGIPFIVLTGSAMVRIWTLVRHRSPHRWLAILAFQYILGGMFSGAIYASGTMWVLMGLVLSPSLNIQKKNDRTWA